jgi:RNA polymerase sigma-70 factor (ECF subfamily)
VTTTVLAVPGGVAVEPGTDFDSLYQRDAPKVAAYVLRLVRDRELAADLTQEAFARLYARFLGVQEPTAFVYRVATNLVRTQWSRDARHRQLLPSLLGRQVDAQPDHTVRDAVARLPEKYRELVLLHYYSDLTVPDVARVVRRPEGTVKRMLSEARALLAVALEDSRG